MRRLHRSVLPLPALLAALLTLSCFDAPIRRGLRLFFDADGSVEIHATTTIRREWSDTDQAAVRRRLDEARDAILHGEDFWSRTFRGLKPRRERVTYDYEDGLLIGAARQAVVDDPGAVEKLFALTAVGAFVEREGGTLTLELAPGGSGDATQRQRQQVDEALETFSALVAEYLEALAAIYRRIEERPAAAPRAMGALLGVEDAGEPLSGRGEGAGAPAWAGEAGDLLDRAVKAGEELGGILTIGGGEAYTLDELSRLVHDPFPSPLEIEVAGEVIEVTGFLRPAARRFATRSHSLWDALDSLRGRWVTPLPMVEAVAALRDRGSSGEVDEEALLMDVLAMPRAVHHVPAPPEVRSALVRELTPPDLYRLRWRLPAPEE